jgi:Domain of unknown function (DUF397)
MGQAAELDQPAREPEGAAVPGLRSEEAGNELPGPRGKASPYHAPGGERANITVADLGIDVSAQRWRRSGSGAGVIEIAFVAADGSPAGAEASDWVLMRVAGDPAERVLVYDRFEWECFLDGAKNGEFDDAT